MSIMLIFNMWWAPCFPDGCTKAIPKLNRNFNYHLKQGNYMILCVKHASFLNRTNLSLLFPRNVHCNKQKFYFYCSSISVIGINCTFSQSKVILLVFISCIYVFMFYFMYLFSSPNEGLLLCYQIISTVVVSQEQPIASWGTSCPARWRVNFLQCGWRAEPTNVMTPGRHEGPSEWRILMGKKKKKQIRVISNVPN